MPTNRELKNKSRELIATTTPSPCLVALVMVIIGLVIDYLMQRIGAGMLVIDMDALRTGNFDELYKFDFSQFTVITGILSLAFRIISVTLSYGFISYMLNVSRRQECGVGDLFDGFAVFLRAILLNIFMSVVITFFSALLVIPGIIAALAYGMAPYLLFDHPEWSAARCMKESRKMMRGHKGELFLLELSFLLWYILALIPGVNVFVAPFTGLANAAFYLHLAGEGDFRKLPESGDNDDRPPWVY